MARNMNNRTNIFVFVVLVLTSLGYFATDVYMPALPSMADDLGSSNSLAQLTIAAYMLSFAISPLVFGPFSDAYGRKLTTYIGLALAIVSTLVCIWAQSMHTIIAARFIQGIGLGAVVTVARAVIPDCYTGRDMAKFNSIITIMMPIMLAIAPTVGGLLEDFYSWRMIFVFLTAYLLLALWLTTFNLKETLKKPDPFSLKIGTYAELLTDARFMYWCLLPPILSIGIAAFITAGPFLFQDLLGLSATQFGMLSMAIGASIFTFAIVNTKLLNYIHTEKLIAVGAALQLISGLFLVACALLGKLTVGTLLTACLIYFTSVPFSFPNGMSLAFDYLKHHFGLAGALFSTLQVFFMFLTSAVFSFLPSYSPYPLAISFVLVGALSYYCLYKQKQLDQIAQETATDEAT